MKKKLNIKKKIITTLIISFVTICSMSFQNVSGIAVNRQTTENYLPQAENQVISYIAEIAALDEMATWTADTKICDTVPVYDMDNSINGYIFNLETYNNPSGYVLVDLVDPQTPTIKQYGYEGKYYLTDEKLFPELASKKLIYLDAYVFLYEEKGDYYIADSSVKVTSELNDIATAYYEKKASRIELNSLKKSTYTTKSTIIYSSVNIPYLWAGGGFYSDFIPTTMWVYETTTIKNHCGPTCGLNMLIYWKDRRGTPNLLLGYSYSVTFDDLRVRMNHNSTTGVTLRNSFLGMQSYLAANGFPTPAGNDYRELSNPSFPGFDWAWITQQINNGNALFIGTTGDAINGSYKSHALLGIGYQVTSVGDFIRVVDQYNTSLSNFLKYEYTNIGGIWYVRW